MATAPNHELTSQQIKEFKETFALFDKNSRGTIKVEDLGSMMRRLGKNPSEQELQNMMKDMDLDGNGEIDFPEFLTMMDKKIKESDSEKEIRQAFHRIDKDRDGYISPKELYKVIRDTGGQLSRDEVNEMVREADLDGDGKVSYEEFRNLMLSQ